ncbi:MAG TPA: DUF3489 domain-containing protein [Bryobacteraceae bacterium]|nr:DUF3489 domain-containing protein [Bryobacteraceae bacterium]
METETGNITAFLTAEAAAAASQTPFDVFTNQQELAELIAQWPADRLLSTYNSLPGVQPLQRLQAPKRAAGKIWPRIAKLGQMVSGEPAPALRAKPKAATKAAVGAPAAHGAPAKGKARKKATAAKAAPKGKKRDKTPSAKTPSTPRAGSKMAQVIALMQLKGGVSISELMQSMGWQRHTVRGFMAGAMKKAGYTVESFKPEGGERSYRLAK